MSVYSEMDLKIAGGTILRKRRREQELPLEILAEKSGISLEKLKKIESMEVTGDLTTLDKIAGVLGLTMFEVMESIEKSAKKSGNLVAKPT